jgi:hypothetical protein
MRTVRTRLWMAIVITVAGVAVTAGVAIWALADLSDRFDAVQVAGDDRALALQIKFDVTDFNGWQTAYGYDEGQSRPIFLRSVAKFRTDLAYGEEHLTSPDERRVLEKIRSAAAEFMRLDAVAFRALNAGRTDEVKRLFLGPELALFQRAATAAEELSALEAAKARREESKFEDARSNALKILLICAIVTAVFVAILIVTALDLTRRRNGES